MKKTFGISVIFSIYILINALLYGLVTSIFFEINSALAQLENSTDDHNINKTTNDTQQQQEIETQCKSPCPLNAEMCIEMCA
ncbi:MAG TPA: hypothetical protein VJ583_11105 [Nitrososphaeraceae archaeon]|nr:hypothetical protein [Nitrososphaeraceae archaeon]